MEKEIRRDKWVLYLLVALLAALTCALMPLNYSVNDDVEMERILSGAYTGTPDAHVVYIQAILAWPITWLYRLFPFMNWYGILLCGLQWLALALVLDRADDCMHDVWNRLLAMGNIILIFFIAVWENYISLTYTTTGGILLAAALYWYVAGDDRPRTQMTTALLVLTGLSLRMEFAPVILAVGGICWLLKVYRSGLRRVFLLPAALGTGFLLMFFAQSLTYGSEEWREFLKFNAARSEVYDYTGVPSWEENRAFYEENHISVNVFEALDIYDLTGRPEITEELLGQVAAYQSGKQKTAFQENVGEALRESVVSFFQDQYGQTLSPMNVLMAAVWLGFILTALHKRKYPCLVTGDGILFLMCAMLFYLAWEGRLLYRVLFVMQLLLAAAGAGLWQYEGKRLISSRKVRRYLLGLLFVALLFPAARALPGYRAHAHEAELQNRDRIVLETYFSQHPEEFFLVTTPLLAPVSDEITLFTRPQPMNYADLGGWLVRSPIYWEKLWYFGIEDVRQALLDGDGYVVTSGRTMDYLFSDEYTEGEDIEYRCVEELSGEHWNYYIYQYILL